jgi:hypothetical protein
MEIDGGGGTIMIIAAEYSLATLMPELKLSL